MAKTHLLGFPRIGENRELKHTLESYWRGDLERTTFQDQIATQKAARLHHAAQLDFAQVGDFSLYDHVLDTSFLLGNIPSRALDDKDDRLSTYFRVARGRGTTAGEKSNQCANSFAGEMTKWFDTNYHYIVPEVSSTTQFSLHAQTLLEDIRVARSRGCNTKPIVLGPLTYLWLARAIDNSDRLALLKRLIPVYQSLFETLAKAGVEWVQVDEPALVCDLSGEWQFAYRYAYEALKDRHVNILLTTFFGSIEDNVEWIGDLPVDGFHVDATHGWAPVTELASCLGSDQVLSVGAINGRNVWAANLSDLYDKLAPLQAQLQQRLWLSTSCSLLHVPVSLTAESDLPAALRARLAFAQEKVGELIALSQALNTRVRPASAGIENTIYDDVQQKNNPPLNDARQSNFATRIVKQREALDLPSLPTTTIGSFPQTTRIRQLRKQFNASRIDRGEYHAGIQDEIRLCIAQQEALGLDVLVHGEAERNDMVEYFGELLEGVEITRRGWVQSYGSRCVKPPIIHSHVKRVAPMTVSWYNFAQSLTDKPVKGMLTGPVTILNWSFVREDQARSDTCFEIASAIREEVNDLERAGAKIIQIDEAALREGLPLKASEKQVYLDWATRAFRISAAGVADETQIHTHMCYSEFNDILPAITSMDADVITIEAARSDNSLLDALSDFKYPNDIGPGVYDIHSPNIPDIDDIRRNVAKTLSVIEADRVWINPDCGLKTREWPEVEDSLRNMVGAAKQLRSGLA